MGYEVIDSRRAYTYFTERYSLRESTNNWFVFDCPFCGGIRKRGVHFGRAYTKCWKCSYAMHIYEFVMEIEGIEYWDAKRLIWDLTPNPINLLLLQDIAAIGEDLINSEVTLPEGFKPLLEGDTNLATRARNYLNGRGFNIEHLERKGFGYCNKRFKEETENGFQPKDFFGYIIIPFKRAGKLVYFIGRDYVGNFLRYKNPPKEWVGVGKSDVIYNEEALDLYDEVFQLEGWADAETMGKQATATLNWAISPYQMRRYMNSDAKRIVAITDAGYNDMGVSFYKLTVKQYMPMIGLGKEIVIVDLNPIADVANDKKDVNSIGLNKVMQQYHRTKPLTLGVAMEALTIPDKLKLL